MTATAVSSRANRITIGIYRVFSPKGQPLSPSSAGADALATAKKVA
jgi:hypothetical protein